LEGVNEKGEIREDAKEQVMKALRTSFRPEFLNRVDDTVLFKPLTVDEIKMIIELLLDEIRSRLRERSIALAMTEAAKAMIAREAYDPVYGARPLKRTLQREIETRLGRKILAGEVPDHSTVNIDTEEDKLVFQIGEGREAESTQEVA
jgi:ATP-dependent Clp protease ATP-binding subunit ClpB